MLHPSLSRWFRLSDRNLCYHHLAHPVFSDMLFVGTVFRRGNRCAQVFATDFGWARYFPMASRSEAPENSSLLFARDGVQLACIWDNAKDMMQGKFYMNLRDAACHLKQLEPYPPWSNAVKREIKELKKGWGPEHQSDYRMTAYSWKPILALILSMRFIS